MTTSFHPDLTTTAVAIIVRASARAGAVVEAFHLLIGFVDKIDSYAGYTLQKRRLTRDFLVEHMPSRSTVRDNELLKTCREAFNFRFTPEALAIIESAIAQSRADSRSRTSSVYLLEALLRADDPEVVRLFKLRRISPVNLRRRIAQPHK